MRNPQYTVTARQVHDLAQHRLQNHLQLQVRGTKCTLSVLYALLFWAAARVTSLTAACAALRNAPSDQAARDALKATLPNLAELQRRLNRALDAGLPKILLRRPVAVAIDLVLLPYYGQPQTDPNELYHGATKASTHFFHAYATAYVLFRGCRYTLALRTVHHADPWKDIVGDLLRQVRQTGVKVRYLLLDRGFYSVEVIQYLRAARCPFIMPAIRRGRKPNHPRGPSGTWALTTVKRSGWQDYTMQDKHEVHRVTVRMAIVRRWGPTQTRSGRQVRRRLQVWLYATWGVEHHSLVWVRETYRRRFGIETSYRQLNQARIRTSSRSPELRLCDVGLALMLRNVWAWLHWEVRSTKRRGQRQVGRVRLTLDEVLQWLQQVIEDWLGRQNALATERPWPKQERA
jgi:hypothetical protein